MGLQKDFENRIVDQSIFNLAIKPDNVGLNQVPVAANVKAILSHQHFEEKHNLMQQLATGEFDVASTRRLLELDAHITKDVERLTGEKYEAIDWIAASHAFSQMPKG